MNRSRLSGGIVLLAVLCAAVAQWAWQLFKPGDPPFEMRSAEIAAKNKNPVADLFNQRPATAATANNFQVTGVVLAQGDHGNMAVLQIDSKPSLAVGVGTEILPGVKVSEVHRDYVLLQDHGQSQRLELPDNVKSQPVVTATPPLPIQSLPVQTTGATPPQNSPASANMVVHVREQTGGLPEIVYARAGVASGAPLSTMAVVAQQIVPSPNANTVNAP